MSKREHKNSMNDNRMVKDSHQEGIGRVIQRKGEGGRVGEPGKMRGMPKERADWKRPNSATTPRKA